MDVRDPSPALHGGPVAGVLARALERAVHAIANGIHIAAVDEPVLPESLDNAGVDTPRLADSHPGPFPFPALAPT